MREIKFRVYDTEKKKLSYGFSIQDLAKEMVQTVIESWVDNLVWQQYTGLKDNNDQEIYEGDTLRSYRIRPKENSEYCLGDYWMEDGSEPFEEVIELFTIVAHETQFFERKYGDGRGGLLNGSDFKDCEVIGNIFEGVDK